MSPSDRVSCTASRSLAISLADAEAVAQLSPKSSTGGARLNTSVGTTSRSHPTRGHGMGKSVSSTRFSSFPRSAASPNLAADTAASSREFTERLRTLSEADGVVTTAPHRHSPSRHAVSWKTPLGKPSTSFAGPAPSAPPASTSTRRSSSSMNSMASPISDTRNLPSRRWASAIAALRASGDRAPFPSCSRSNRTRSAEKTVEDRDARACSAVSD
mmetsp:Transcript_34296/g.103408  ORF Transcript_34296/g.103408 Transcript_34296/m.103408 type:complete len:215 (-) Transcript_34296:158-802(-)